MGMVTMVVYTLLCIEDGRVIERSGIEADCDEEALALLSLHGEKTDCELWCGERKVAAVARGSDPRLAGSAGDGTPLRPSRSGFANLDHPPLD